MQGISIVSLVKSTDCIPQTARSSLSSAPNPGISHLAILGLKPEKEKNKLDVFASSLIDSLFLRKKDLSSA